MKLPAIVVNFKIYEKGVSKEGIKTAKLLEKKAEDLGISLAVAVNAIDLRMFVEELEIPVFLQHMDSVGFGAHTGHICAEMVKDSGAYGVLLNHSEKRMLLADLSAAINRAKMNNLKTLVCADTVESSKGVAALGPDYLAVEPPELIGGDISVSKARPEVVSGTVEAVAKISPDIPVLCGAGVKTGEDVKKAIELGAKGVLVASGVVKAKDPAKALEELARGLL